MKRLRTPMTKPGELKVQWGKLPHENPDMVFCWGDGSSKHDSNLLHYFMASKRPDPQATPLYSKMIPSLFEELEARGYDLTTLKFSIQKKPAQEPVSTALMATAAYPMDDMGRPTP